MANVELSQVAAPVLDQGTLRRRAGLLRRGLHNRPLAIGSCLLVIVVFLSAFPSLLSGYDPVQVNVRDRMQPPNLTHLFGTDQYGRDMLVRVLYGGRISLV